MKSTKSELWEVCMLSLLLENLIMVGLRAGPHILTFLLTYNPNTPRDSSDQCDPVLWDK